MTCKINKIWYLDYRTMSVMKIDMRKS